MPDELWINDVLLEILNRRKRNRRTLSPYIFYKPSLKTYSEFDALKVWKKACEGAEVADCTPRDVRHKSLTDMGKAGHDLARVGHVARRSDTRTTKRYAHFSINETRAPLEALTRVSVGK